MHVFATAAASALTKSAAEYGFIAVVAAVLVMGAVGIIWYLLKTGREDRKEDRREFLAALKGIEDGQKEINDKTAAVLTAVVSQLEQLKAAQGVSNAAIMAEIQRIDRHTLRGEQNLIAINSMLEEALERQSMSDDKRRELEELVKGNREKIAEMERNRGRRRTDKPEGGPK